MLTFDYDRAGIRRGDVVLDIGCGPGRHTYEALRRGASTVAVDLDAAVLKDVKAHGTELGYSEGLCCAAGNVLALPFRDESFEHVVAAEVMEHVRRDETALAELARVVRPGGTVVVSVPRFWPERVCWALSRAYRDKPGGHVRIYRAGDLRRKMIDVGLQPFGAHHAHALHSPYWWLRCAVGIEDEDALLPRLYHRFLVWDLMRKPRATRMLERALDPVLGKSLVVYSTRTAGA